MKKFNRNKKNLKGHPYLRRDTLFVLAVLGTTLWFAIKLKKSNRNKKNAPELPPLTPKPINFPEPQLTIEGFKPTTEDIEKDWENTPPSQSPAPTLNESSEDEIITLTPKPINFPEPQLIIEGFKPTTKDIEKDWGNTPPKKNLKGHPYLRWGTLFVLAILGTTLWFTIKPHQQSTTKIGQIEKTPKLAPPQQTAQQKERGSHQTLSAIKKCLQDYLSANTVAEISAHSRNPKRVQPLMVDYYRTHSRPHLAFQSIEAMKVSNIKGCPFLLIRSEVTDLDHSDTETQKNTFRSLVLEQTGKFEFKVDWELDVFHQPMPWSEFTSKRPLKPLAMRVLVTKDHFYAFAFRNSAQYQCYLLQVPGKDASLFGYAKRGSLLESRLNELLAPTKKSNHQNSETIAPPINKTAQTNNELSLETIQAIKMSEEKNNPSSQVTRPMILKIRFLKDDRSKRGVLIDSLVAENWMY